MKEIWEALREASAKQLIKGIVEAVGLLGLGYVLVVIAVIISQII